MILTGTVPNQAGFTVNAGTLQGNTTNIPQVVVTGSAGTVAFDEPGSTSYTGVVTGAASIEIPVFDHAKKGIDGPLLPLYSDDIEMCHEQQRARFPRTPQTGDDIAASRGRLEDFRGNAVLVQDALNVLRGLGFVPWRIAGIDLDELQEEIAGVAIAAPLSTG